MWVYGFFKIFFVPFMRYIIYTKENLKYMWGLKTINYKANTNITTNQGKKQDIANTSDGNCMFLPPPKVATSLTFIIISLLFCLVSACPPGLLSIPHLDMYPKRNTFAYYINRFFYPLVSSWMWPKGGTEAKTENLSPILSIVWQQLCLFIVWSSCHAWSFSLWSLCHHGSSLDLRAQVSGLW